MSSTDPGIYFIDAELADLDSVLAAVPAGAEMHLLDRGTDGLAQMLAVLGGRSGVASLHLVTHGAPGAAQLGASWLDVSLLQTRAADFAALGATLAAGGDLLIYGSHVGAGATGLAFLDALAQATGADVAASTGLTGAGGDWLLEAATGAVEATALAVPEMQGVLTIANTAPSFSVGDGAVTTPVGTSYSYGKSVAVQPDGKILVAGAAYVSGTSLDIAVVRYHADGTLDTSFGSGGKVTSSLGWSSDAAEAMILLPDGRIVLAGHTSTGSQYDFALVRYTADGVLDTSFGSGGKVITPVGTGSEQAYSLALQADGSLLVAGYSHNGTNDDFALLRYTADGLLDTSFSGDGKVTTDFGLSKDYARSVAVLPDGKVLVAGYRDNGSGSRDFALARYNSDGSLDTGFSGDGLLVTDLGSASDAAYSMSVQPDGKILLAGESAGAFALVRYNADGTPDTGFGGGDGIIATDILASSTDRGYGVTLQPDGKILVAGQQAGATSLVALVRYNSDGSLDTSFSGDGIVTRASTNANAYELAYSVTLQPDGKILLTGSAYGSTDMVLLVRYNSDGSLDKSFDVVDTLGGTVGFTEGSTAVALDRDVVIRDAELDALNGGLGNYDGASLTLSRQGGAVAEDRFSASSSTLGALTEGADLTVGGVVIGTVTSNSAGLLVLSFNAGATTALVNQALRLIAYSNSSDTPPASVQLAWSFSDGNTGTQGTGGVQLATGSMTVNITATNDAPVASIAPTGYNAAEQAALTLKGTGLSVSDVDAGGSVLTATLSVGEGVLTVTAGGSGATVGGSGSKTVTLSGTAAQINALLSSDAGSTVSYLNPLEAASASTTLTLSVNDGGNSGTGGAKTASDTATITLAPVNDAPSFSVGDGKLTTALGSGNDSGRSVVTQPDGKILVAGNGSNGSNDDFALVRYNADGSLDTSFGSGGKLLTGVGSSHDYGYSVVLQPDGKIVVAGSSSNGINYDFAVVRYHANGTLDTSFGTAGKLITPMGSGMDQAYSVALQSDGKLVVAGYGYVNLFALARYNADGTLDTSFSNDGKVSDPFTWSGYEFGRSVVVQPDGKILVAGGVAATNASNYDFAVVRYNADGTLDTSFSGDGKVTTTGGHAWSMVLQSDGKIVVAGYSFNGLNYEDFSLARYNANGTLDTSFGSSGKVLTAIGASTDLGYSVVLQPDGKLLLGGYSYYGGSDEFTLLRYNSNGTLDTSFGNSGKVITPVGSGSDRAYSVTLQPDGRIVVVGQSFNGSNDDIALVRYNANGTLDTSFDAVNTLDGTRSFTEGGTAVVLDADVSIRDTELDALNGGLGSYAGASLTIARQGGAHAEDIFRASGSLGGLIEGGDLRVGSTAIGTVSSNSGGTLLLSFNGNATTALVNQAMRLIAYGNSSDTPPASVKLAWSFSDGNAGAQGTGGAQIATGTVTVNIAAVNDAPTATIVPTSYSASEQTVLELQGSGLSIADPDAGDSWISAQLSVSEGTLTVTAGDSGVSIVDSGTSSVRINGTVAQINALLSGAAGGTVSYLNGSDAPSASATLTLSVNDWGYSGSGGIKTASDSATIQLSGLNDAPSFVLVGDGKLTTALGTGNDAAYCSALQPDGKLLVAGMSEIDGQTVFALVRYNADSTLDLSFGNGGKVFTAVDGYTQGAAAIAVQPDGRIVVTGIGSGPLSQDFTLLRYHPDGSLDTGFGNGGRVTTDLFNGSSDQAHSVLLQPDGRIVVAGVSAGFDGQDIALARYNADGSLDTSFGNGGRLLTNIDGLSADAARSVVLQSDGRIVVAGYSSSYTTGQLLQDFVLVRYNADGTLDAGFGNGGKLTTDLGSGTEGAWAVCVQPDGKIVVAGEVNLGAIGSYNDFALVRYNADGSLDTGFGNGGKVTTNLDTYTLDYPCDMALQSDGRIVVAGYSYIHGSYDFALVRYNADGSLDTGFGNGGKVTTALGSGPDMGYSIEVLPDGKIVVAGSSRNGSGNDDFALVRYNADGSLDTGFDGPDTLGGTVSFTQGGPAVVLDADVVLRDAELDALNGGLGNYAGATLTIARNGGANAEDRFSATGTFGPLTEGSSLLADSSLIGTVTTNSGGTLTITFTSKATTALVNQVMRQIAYSNSSDTPPSSVQLDWTFSDGNTGTQGSGGAQTATGTTTVLIAGVNDAPVAVDDTLSAVEDTTLTWTVAQLLGNDSDADGDPLSIVALGDAVGGTVTLNPDGTVSFTPAADFHGEASFSYTVSDGTATSAPATVTVDVAAVNDAPTAGDRTVATDEDVACALTLADFGFADADAGDSLQALLVTSLPARGRLTLDGVAVTTGQSISAADIAAGKLVFTPAANASGTGYASFGFRVGDGNALSVQTYTMSIDVAPVRDDLVKTGTAGNDVLSGDTVDVGSHDLLSGLDGHDALSGGAGSDTLDGGAGNDWLDGGSGADSLLGGGGNDTYVVDDAGDVVVEEAGAGSDTVRSTVDHSLAANVENLLLLGSAGLAGRGNALANALTGNAGANLLDGGAGNDWLDGGTGADTLVGGTGNDIYLIDDAGDVVAEQAGEGTDVVRSSVSFALDEQVENLQLLGSAGLTGHGNALANALSGNAGANLLDGRAGDDQLDGGAGADTLVGGTGNDVYLIDNTGDVVAEKAGEGTDTVRSSVSFVLYEQVEHLQLTGSADLWGIGNALANALSGNAGGNLLDGGAGNDWLDGGSGADTLLGGAGHDVYQIDNAGDLVIEEAGAGTDSVRSGVSHLLAEQVENLQLLGSADLWGRGNALANSLSGNAGANVLAGGAGADTLAGGLGDDVFLFDAALGTVDRLSDFAKAASNSDRIWLDDDIFTDLGSVTQPTELAAQAFCLGKSATTAEHRIVYDATSGALYYDADGAGGAAQVQFALLGSASRPVLAASDFAIVS